MPSDDDVITAGEEASVAGEPLPATAGDTDSSDEPPGPPVAPEPEAALTPEEPAVAGEPESETAAAEPEPESETEPQPEAAAKPESSPPADERPVPHAADAALVEGVGGGLTWVPFACYMGSWVILAGVTAYLLTEAAGDTPARWTPIYTPLVWAGVALTALGPVLSLVVWLIARTRRPKAGRRGLFASAMTRGALIAFFGVVIWLGTLFVLEILAARGTL